MLKDLFPKATPRPWRHHDLDGAALIGADKRTLADFAAPAVKRSRGAQEDNAAATIHAINHHDGLVSVLEGIARLARSRDLASTSFQLNAIADAAEAAVRDATAREGG